MKMRTKLMSMVLVAVLCLSMALAGLATDNSAPVAENLELATYRGISIGGRLSAVDPDGDIVYYEITTEPTKGTVEVNDDGRFVYSPEDGKKGKDYFGYKAVDSAGNYSQEATVIIKIEKQKTSVMYSDMSKDGGHYAAVFMAENNLYVGECLGGQYLFHPEEEVTRGEFLAMCMQIADYKVLSGVKSTGFADDDNIPAWVKPYVSTALMNSIITGYTDKEMGAVFNSNLPINYSEAAVMLNNILEITDVVKVSGIDESAVPTWALQATANLAACDIIPSGTSSMSQPLTRLQAAEMLMNAATVLSNR